jgi:hypothetical protein
MYKPFLNVMTIEHVDADGKVLWKQENLHNIFHINGEEYMLKALFAGFSIPGTYYFGLDNRGGLDDSDTLNTISTSGNEPTVNGYFRQGVGSTSFTVAVVGSHNLAQSPIVSFSASGGSWGPVSNLFMATTSDNLGHLISSVPLSQLVTLDNGQSINVRLGLSLKDCTSC